VRKQKREECAYRVSVNITKLGNVYQRTLKPKPTAQRKKERVRGRGCLSESDRTERKQFGQGKHLTAYLRRTA